MQDWWSQRPAVFRWATWASGLAAIILLSNFQGAMTKAAQAMPVLWFQLYDYIDGRAQKRDQQMDNVRQDAINANLTGIGNLKQILTSRIIDIDMRLRITPSDRVLLDARADAQGDLDEAVHQEHIQRCRLSQLTDAPSGAC